MRNQFIRIDALGESIGTLKALDIKPPEAATAI
jgi:hypothetical protein